jgi:hypothetical protein
VGGTIAVDVLGPLRIVVDGEIVHPPAQVAPLVTALAVADRPLGKLELARDVLYLSPRSIDSRLSRLHRLLGVDQPLHRVPVPRSGLVEIDDRIVTVDARRFRSLVAEAESLIAAGRSDEGLDRLLEADDLWRDGPLSWEPLGDPHGRTAFGRARQDLLQRRRRVRESAARLGPECHRRVSPARLVRWTREPDASSQCWHARIVSELDRRGPAAARAALAMWPRVQTADADRTRRWTELLVAHGRQRGAWVLPAEPGRPPVVTIGRERERAALWQHAEAIVHGCGGLHVVTGQAGSGKSHLLARLERHAESDLGLRVVHVDVEERTGFHRALRHALTPLWQDVLRRTDPPHALVERGDEIATFLGEPSMAGPMGVDGHEPVAPIAHAERIVGSLLCSLPRPTLVIFDNIHRASPELPQLLTVLARRWLGPAGIVASFRPGHDAADALAEEHPVTVLDPLDRAAAALLLSTTRGGRIDERAVDRLYRQSGGLPLALLHAKDDGFVPADGPSLASTLSRWLDRRSPEARRALGVAAVLAEGTRFDIALAESLLADEPDAVRALRGQLDAGVAIERRDGVGAFTHRAWRDIAYAGVEPHRRRSLHQRVLQFLERRLGQASDPDGIAACALAIAHHAGAADRGGLATTIGVGAVVRAADSLGPFETSTALRLYGCALEIARPEDQLAILLRQGRLRRLAAEWDDAEADLRAAVEVAENLGDVVAEAEATLLMAHITWDPQRWDGTLRSRLVSLLERVPEEEVTVRARLQACLAGGSYQDGVTGTGPDTGTLARAAAAAVDRLEPGDAAEVLMWARKGLLDDEPPEATLQMAKRMRRLARGSSYLTANAILATVVDHIRLGDDASARTDSDAYRTLAASTGSPVQGYVAATLDALWSLHDGRFDEAETAIRTAERLGAEFGGTTARQVVKAQRVVLMRESADPTALARFTRRLDDSRPADGRIPAWGLAVAWLFGECGVVDEAGDRLRRIAAQFDDFRDLPRGPHRIVSLAFAAETLWHVERAGRSAPADRRIARRVHELLSAHPDRHVLLGWPAVHLGPKDRFVGLSALAAGDHDGGLAHLRRALRQSASRPHRARTLLDVATVAAGVGGDRADPRGPIRAAANARVLWR